jgi:hypothetical protein
MLAQVAKPQATAVEKFGRLSLSAPRLPCRRTLDRLVAKTQLQTIQFAPMIPCVSYANIKTGEDEPK